MEKKIEKAHYLVHIGFDESPQKKFEEEIFKYIEGLKSRLNDILVFVDLPIMTNAEVEIAQILSIADSIGDFLSTNSSCSFNILSNNYLLNNLYKKHPKEVIDYLYELLGEDCEIIKIPVPLFNIFIRESEWKGYGHGPSNIFPDLSRYTEISKQCEEYDSFYKNIYLKKFLDTLLKTIEKFKGKNIYGLECTGGNKKYRDVSNQKRRNKIGDFALDKLGENRIFFSNMDEEDLVAGSNNINVQNLETTFGNAVSFRHFVVQKYFKIKTRRYRDELFLDFYNKGFEATEKTQHIVGGEYISRCVNIFAYQLASLFWFNERNIFINRDISLTKACDVCWNR